MRSSFDTRRWPQAEGLDARALSVAAAVVGSAVVGGVMSSQSQKSAADTAAAAQTQASEAGIAERRAEFDRVQGLLSPFVQAATGRPAVGSSSFGGSAPPTYTAGNGGQIVPGGSAPGGTTYTTPTSYPQQWTGWGGTDVSWQSQPTLASQSDPNWHPPTYYNPNYNPSDPSTYTGIPASAFTKPADVGVPQQATAQTAGMTQATGAAPGAGGAGGAGGGYMAPGGGGSLGAQQDIIGLNGAGPQQAAIDNLQRLPAFTSALKLGENRILQNASATGGMRGGNTQGALAYFAPQLLAQQINDYYGRLAGITSLGQNAAAMVGNAGMQTGAGVSDLLQQGGSAQAGAALAGGRAQSSLYSSMSGALGQYVGMGGGFGGFGGGVTPDAIQGAFAQTGAGGSGFGTGFAYGNQDYGQFI